MHLHHKKKYIYLFVIFALTGLVFYFLFYYQKQNIVIINNQQITVDIADTPEKRMLGLSGRKSLCETCGMFFIFENEDYQNFWMKDMNFDIDIIWIRDRKVVDIAENVSHKTPKKVLKSTEKSDHVLEVSAGFVSKSNIRIGDEIIFD